MTKQFKISRRLHLATICCFLLPFFYTGCGATEEEKAEEEKVEHDSIPTLTNQTSTTFQDSFMNKSIDSVSEKNFAQIDTTKTQTESIEPDTFKTKKEESPSEQIINKFTFLRPVLMPAKYTYSGLGTIINTTPYIRFFTIVISFLILLLCFVVKFIDKKALKTIVLLEILVFVFLIISKPHSWDFNILWGFWVTVVFSFALTLYDIYILNLTDVKNN